MLSVTSVSYPLLLFQAGRSGQTLGETQGASFKVPWNLLPRDRKGETVSTRYIMTMCVSSM